MNSLRKGVGVDHLEPEGRRSLPPREREEVSISAWWMLLPRSVKCVQKNGKDAGEWMLRMNRCWFAGRVVAVKRKYGLTVDAREARALEGVLTGCASTEMVVAEGQAQVAEPTLRAGAASTGDALSRWDTNGDGRITCKEAREHGIAPVHREHPAYRFMRDGDGDGVVCE